MNRPPVQLTGKERYCVLVHATTNRILCFAMDDPFADSFSQLGYRKEVINHASDYDRWAKRLREQSKIEDEAQDLAYLERENFVRRRLRQELKDRMASVDQPSARKAIEDALHALDFMEARRQRYRSESFMVQEGYEDKSNVGEEILVNLSKPAQSK